MKNSIILILFSTLLISCSSETNQTTLDDFQKPENVVIADSLLKSGKTKDAYFEIRFNLNFPDKNHAENEKPNPWMLYKVVETSIKFYELPLEVHQGMGDYYFKDHFTLVDSVRKYHPFLEENIDSLYTAFLINNLNEQNFEKSLNSIKPTILYKSKTDSNYVNTLMNISLNIGKSNPEFVGSLYDTLDIYLPEMKSEYIRKAYLNSADSDHNRRINLLRSILLLDPNHDKAYNEYTSTFDEDFKYLHLFLSKNDRNRKTYGLINEVGEIIASDLEERPFGYVNYRSAACVESNERNRYGYLKVCGYKDPYGFFIIKPQYEFHWDMSFVEERALVHKNGRAYYIDLKGNYIHEGSFSRASRTFSEGYAAVKKEGKWGFIDINGDIVIDFIYDSVKDFNEGFSVVRSDNEIFFIDNSGNRLTTPPITNAISFSDGYAAVEAFGKWGFINKKGTMVIEPKIMLFERNRGSKGVNLYFKDGLMDLDGEYYLLDNGSRNARTFTNMVRLINKEDQLLEWHHLYSIKDFKNELAVATLYAHPRNNDWKKNPLKWGMVDTDGEWKIKPKYFDMKYINDNVINVKNSDYQWGVINIDGELIVPFEMDIEIL